MERKIGVAVPWQAEGSVFLVCLAGREMPEESWLPDFADRSQEVIQVKN